MAWAPPETGPAPVIWRPQGAQAGEALLKIFLCIAGPSGVGKSHLIAQLCEDEDYGPDEVLVLMAVNSVASYGQTPPKAIVNVERFDDMTARSREIAKAHSEGARLPRVVVVDNLTSLGDAQMRYYRLSEPFKTEGKVLVNPGWLAVYGKEAQSADEPMLAKVLPNEKVATEEMRVQGGADMPERLTSALGDVVGAVRRRYAAEKATERAEIEREIRAQVGDEIAALRHDGPMSTNGSADRAFTNALVIAERTARGGQR